MIKRILFFILILCFSCFTTNAQQFIPEHDLKAIYTYRLNNRNDSALFLLNKISQKFATTNQESGYVYTEMGNIYYQLSLDKIALKVYTRSVEVFENTNDLLGKSIALSNSATVLERTNQSDSSRILFTQALAIQKSINDSAYIAFTLRGLALFELRRKNNELAKKYFQQSLQFYKSKNIQQHPRYRWDVQFIPQQLFLAGFEVYKAIGQPDTALQYMNLALQATEKFGIPQHQVRYKTFLANYLTELKKFEQAESQLKEATYLAKKYNYQWGEFGVLQAYRNFYKAQRDSIQTALATLRFFEFKDKVFNNKNNDELLVMSNLVLQYENELEIRQQKNIIKEKEEINTLQRKLNQTLLFGLVLVALVLVFILYLYRSLRKSNSRITDYVKEVEMHNETMRMLLSVISHDVRAPFRSLLGLTKITMMEKELPAEEVQQRVAMMHDTAAKGSILLDNLLQWVALQRDKVLIEKSPVNTVEILDEVTQELANLSLTENVKLERQIFQETMFTDRNGFKMIIRNLLTNAIRYSSGKKVWIALKEIDKFVYLHVTDSGPGIPEELLQNLFSTGDMKKVAAKGGGLGLQIVKEMVLQLGGDIRAINLPEGGARFEVRLPN